MASEQSGGQDVFSKKKLKMIHSTPALVVST